MKSAQRQPRHERSRDEAASKAVLALDEPVLIGKLGDALPLMLGLLQIEVPGDVADPDHHRYFGHGPQLPSSSIRSDTPAEFLRDFDGFMSGEKSYEELWEPYLRPDSTLRVSHRRTTVPYTAAGPNDPDEPDDSLGS